MVFSGKTAVFYLCRGVAYRFFAYRMYGNTILAELYFFFDKEVFVVVSSCIFEIYMEQYKRECPEYQYYHCVYKIADVYGERSMVILCRRRKMFNITFRYFSGFIIYSSVMTVSMLGMVFE